MAADAKVPAPVTNGTHVLTKPIELSISLPHSPGVKVYLHLTILATSILLFVTSAAVDAGQAGASMGSLIYAMPDRYNPSQPLSTQIYSHPSFQDFSTRLAKVLVRKTRKLCYVGSSINLSNAAGGGTVEEEMEAFWAIVDVVLTETIKAVEHSSDP